MRIKSKTINPTNKYLLSVSVLATVERPSTVHMNKKEYPPPVMKSQPRKENRYGKTDINKHRIHKILFRACLQNIPRHELDCI